MKNIKLSFLAYVCVSGIAFAGGDIDAPALQEQVVDTSEMEMSEKTDFYAGLALSALSARESGVSLNFAGEKSGQDRVGNATLLVGYDINPYAAVEARYTATVTSSDTAKMSSISIFLKPQYPVSNELSVYGLLGYGKVKLDSNNQSNVDVSKGGFQWGLELDYDVTSDISMFVEYASLAHNMDGTFLTADSASVDAISVGLTYRF